MKAIAVIEFDDWISQNDVDRLRAAWKIALCDPSFPLVLPRAHAKVLYLPDDNEMGIMTPEDAEQLRAMIDRAMGKNDIAGA